MKTFDRNLLILFLLLTTLLSCKKEESSTPLETLNNTTWTGYFTYSPFRDNLDNSKIAIIPFGMQLLTNGKFKFYEALGISEGKWKIKNDTLTIYQANGNIIIFKYSDKYPKGELSFVRMDGPPDAWSASGMEQYNPQLLEIPENTKWLENNRLIFEVISTHPDARVNNHLWLTYNTPVFIEANMMWWQTKEEKFFTVLRSKDKLAYTYTYSEGRYTAYDLSRKAE